MNLKEMQAKRELLNKIRYTNRSGSHINCIRLSHANTWQHELKKVEVCWELLKQKKEFITEAIFENGSRADILNLTDGIVIEILHTETVEKFKEKIKKYPIDATYILTSEDAKTI